MTTGTEGRIQTLDVSRADFALLWQQSHQLGHASLNQTLVYSNDTSPLVLLHHLGYHHPTPNNQGRATSLPGLLRFAKGIAPRLDIAPKTIGDEQEGGVLRAPLDRCRQLLEQLLVP